VPGGTGGEGGISYVDNAKKKMLAEWGPEKFAVLKAVVKHGHHGHDGHEATNTGSRSRVVTGLTGALSTSVAGHDAHSTNSHSTDSHGMDAGQKDKAPGGH
jgi:hypothetical protein